MARSIVYTGLATFVPLFFANVLGRPKGEAARALALLLGTGSWRRFSGAGSRTGTDGASSSCVG